MTTESSTAYSAGAAVALAAQRGEPDWLSARREAAARAFDATPMPTPMMRPWKYTDVSGLSIEQFAPGGESVHRADAGATNGAFVGSLGEAVNDPEWAATVEEHLGTLVPATEGRFVAANAANWRDGLAVLTPRGSAIAEPVVVDVTDAGTPGSDASGLFPRVLVVAAPASEITLVLRSTSGDAELLHSGVIEIFAAADSHVRLLLDTRWGPRTRDFTIVRSRLDRGATQQVTSTALGGQLVKQTIEAMLEGEGAHSNIRGIALGEADQHFDFVTLQDHIGAHTNSNVEIRAALAGESRSVYYGVTRVEETGVEANAEQSNRNLILSDRAKADSDPVLEILTSQVIRCGHGATVGPVDQDALFYLQSRGLSRRQALRLLVSGFFRSIIAGAASESIEEEIAEAVSAKLDGLDIN
jgi:Fe-S cluster assembly protein SufD